MENQIFMAFLSQQDKSFRYKVIIVVMVIVLLWMFLEYVRLVYRRQYQIGLKKQAWIQEIEAIEAENRLLPREYQYYGTEYFLKKEAKRKLNRKEANEKVLIVVGDGDRVGSTSRITSEEVSFPSAWWSYIFGRSQREIYEGEGVRN